MTDQLTFPQLMKLRLIHTTNALAADCHCTHIEEIQSTAPTPTPPPPPLDSQQRQ